MTPPFSAVSKSCDPPSVSTPLPPLIISDKSPNFCCFAWFHYKNCKNTKKFTEVSLLSSTIQLLQSDLLIKYILDYKSRPPKFRAESKYCSFFSLALVHGAYEKPSSAVAQYLNKSKPNLPFLTVTDSFVKLKCVKLS